MDNGRENLPEDYEPCGECGFDHGYEYEEALKWHNHKHVEDIVDAVRSSNRETKLEKRVDVTWDEETQRALDELSEGGTE
jgi:hypothetical protein